VNIYSTFRAKPLIKYTANQYIDFLSGLLMTFFVSQTLKAKAAVIASVQTGAYKMQGSFLIGYGAG
jgi:uncharacterized protein (DUF2164 family)